MINWELNDKEAEYVINVLMRQPFAEVNHLITKLVTQANRKPVPDADQVVVPAYQHPE